MINLRCTPAQALDILHSVRHQTFQNAIERNWRLDRETMRIKNQSICWLFCWGMTGINSINASSDARNAFNQIFTVEVPLTFEEFENQVGLDWARHARHIKNFDNLPDIPEIFR